MSEDTNVAKAEAEVKLAEENAKLQAELEALKKAKADEEAAAKLAAEEEAKKEAEAKKQAEEDALKKELEEMKRKQADLEATIEAQKTRKSLSASSSPVVESDPFADFDNNRDEYEKAALQEWGIRI